MRLKVTCPLNPQHNRFSVVATVQELWEVDEHGDYIEVLESLDVVSSPDSQSHYICRECDADASAAFVVDDEEEPGQRVLLDPNRRLPL